MLHSPRESFLRRRAAPLVFLLLLFAGAARAEGPTVRLDGLGGDAWTFTKRVTGQADAACDRVEVHAGAWAVAARLDGAAFDATVPLAPGDNEVVAVCRLDDGRQARSTPVRWRVPLRDGPVARIEVGLVEGGVRLDGGASSPGEAERAPLVAWRWTARPTNPAPLRLPPAREPAGTDGPAGRPASAPKAAADRAVTLPAPTQDGEYYVALEVTDAAGRTDRAETYFVVRGGRPALVDHGREHPAWVDQAVVYGVVPFLYGPRGLDDVRPHLDRLRALGVNTLWLSPILDAPDDDFGYAVTDYFAVRRAYGTRQALRRLVDDAHARGMRVVLDFVPNHTSHRHPYFEHAERHGEASPYHAWYERGPDGQAEHYFDWKHLPNLDYDHPEVRRFMREAFAWWVRELDVDGFRVDVAWGVQARAPDFWPALRRELKRIKPDVLLVAEASARDGDLFANGFDVAYDWTEKPGHWAWGEVFTAGKANLAKLRAALSAPPAAADAVTMRFFDNNDTGERFVTRHGPGLERAAAGLVFTLPGIPSLFTGVEAGAEYHPYERVEPLDLTPRAPIADTLARLAALRQREPALTRGALALAETTRDDAVLAYVRHGPGRPLLVALNFGAEPVRTVVTPPAPVRDRLEGPLRDLMDGGAVAPDGRPGVTLTLPPHAVRVLAPAG